jgi:predicted transcriptional regulator
MAKNCKKQLSGTENRKRAKIKAIKNANVLSKVAKLDAYFNINDSVVNSVQNTSSTNIY